MGEPPDASLLSAERSPARILCASRDGRRSLTTCATGLLIYGRRGTGSSPDARAIMIAMIVLGLVLLVLAAALGVGIVVGNPAVLELGLYGAQMPR